MSKFQKELYVKGAARCLADSDGFVNANSGDMAFEVARRWNSHEALMVLAELCAGLNEHNPEIGAGMLMQIVTDAREALKLARG